MFMTMCLGTKKYIKLTGIRLKSKNLSVATVAKNTQQRLSSVADLVLHKLSSPLSTATYANSKHSADYLNVYSIITTAYYFHRNALYNRIKTLTQ